jgi:hypothetical protein
MSCSATPMAPSRMETMWIEWKNGARRTMRHGLDMRKPLSLGCLMQMFGAHDARQIVRAMLGVDAVAYTTPLYKWNVIDPRLATLRNLTGTTGMAYKGEPCTRPAVHLARCWEPRPGITGVLA